MATIEDWRRYRYAFPPDVIFPTTYLNEG